MDSDPSRAKGMKRRFPRIVTDLNGNMITFPGSKNSEKFFTFVNDRFDAPRCAHSVTSPFATEPQVEKRLFMRQLKWKRDRRHRTRALELATSNAAPRGWGDTGEPVQGKIPADIGLTDQARTLGASAICEEERKDVSKRVVEMNKVRNEERRIKFERIEARRNCHSVSPELLRPPTPWEQRMVHLMDKEQVTRARVASAAQTIPPLSPERTKYLEAKWPMTNNTFWRQRSVAEDFLENYDRLQEDGRRAITRDPSSAFRPHREHTHSWNPRGCGDLHCALRHTHDH